MKDNPFNLESLYTSLDQSLNLTNTENINDNCYLCTIAYILKTSTSNLREKQGWMEIDIGTSLDNIMNIIATNFTYFIKYGPCCDNKLLETVTRLDGEFLFGFAFTRTNGSGHMIVGMKYQNGISFYDAQTSQYYQDILALNSKENISSYYVMLVKK